VFDPLPALLLVADDAPFAVPLLLVGLLDAFLLLWWCVCAPLTPPPPPPPLLGAAAAGASDLLLATPSVVVPPPFSAPCRCRRVLDSVFFFLSTVDIDSFLMFVWVVLFGFTLTLAAQTASASFC
jgi:hypothetical protein